MLPTHPAFPRHATSVPLNEIETVAFEELETAAEMMKSATDFGRSGVKYAIDTCLSFFLARGLSGQALKPLADLAAALEAVSAGNLPEIFDPQVKAGTLPKAKWSKSPAADETRIWAVACMDALMKLGSSKANAARRVARACTAWPRVSTGEIKPSTVTNWRDELLQAPPSDANAAAFRQYSKYLSEPHESGKRLKTFLKNGPPFAPGIRRSDET